MTHASESANVQIDDRARFWDWQRVLVALSLLLALVLRLWGLADVPPGWRDDELSNSLVLSQHVLDGDLRLFYADASGHEFLYHAVNALFLRLFGPGLWGIRLLSVLVGTGVVWLTYLLARELFDWQVGLTAALGVTTSFWALMYSRMGQRHISAVLFALTAFLFLWRALNGRSKPLPNAALAGLTMGIGFYTYFASRIPPVVVAALALYLALLSRKGSWEWRVLAVTLIVAGGLYLPLWYAARTTPGAEARVDELAVPVKALQEGDWEPLLRQLGVTLKMFHADGDDEWLYNVAHRPVFGPPGAVLFFGGLLLTIIRALPRLGRFGDRADPRYAFLLLWLASALVPGVVAVPAASLGHTLLALPVTYIFPALALVEGTRWLQRRWPRTNQHLPLILLALLFLGTESYRGLHDYFSIWPERGFVRLLHNADYRDVAQYLNDPHSDVRGEPGPDLFAASGRDVAIGGALVERWEQEALKIDLDGTWCTRWFDPRRALVSPAGAGYLVLTLFPEPDPHLSPLLEDRVQTRAQTFTVYQAPSLPLEQPLARFEDGLALHGVSEYRLDDGQLTWTTTWAVERPLDLPPNPLLSKPPPPGMPAGPRLAIFVHLLDGDGAYVAGQDGLGVDPYTLQPGDRFVHLHRLPWPEGMGQASHSLRLGLYDPLTGDRWRTDKGDDGVQLPTFAGDGE